MTKILPATLAATEIAIRDDLVSKARSFADKASAQRTRQEYDRCWRKFEAWCEASGRQAMPAGLDTLAAYMTWLATGQDRGRSLAVSSINQALSAIRLAHRLAKHPLDIKDVGFLRVWSGIRREIASKRTIRRVKALLVEDLRDILESLKPDVLRDARDAAVLSIMFGAARRRSEVVGLDWQWLGTGNGFLVADEKGLSITLMTSKTSQEGAQEYLVARKHAALLCTKVEEWVALAKIEPGSPICRAIEGKGEGKSVSPKRLHHDGIPRIIKRRMYLLLKARNAGRRKISVKDLKEQAAQYSGHSPRVGHVTSAAERGVPAHHIKDATGHKGDAMIALYSRVSDRVEKSSLKGSGL